MKLGFICLDLPGHLNPMSSLALQLQARNQPGVAARGSEHHLRGGTTKSHRCAIGETE